MSVRSSVPVNGYAIFSGTSMALAARGGHGGADVVGGAGARRATSPRPGGCSTTRAIDTSSLACGGTADDNNVWGEGRLDAFAAVERARR